LGERGQGKTRIIRRLIDLLDPVVPAIRGCDINDDPLRPVCAACRRRAAQAGDRPHDLDHERGLVPLAAVRRRGQERAVRLHEEAVEGHRPRHLLDDLGPREGRDPGERDVEAEGEGAAGQLVAAGEAMDDPGAGALLLEKGRGLVAVISDFYCDPDALLKSVQPLAYKGQDVILFQLLDPHELKPVMKESALLEDMESGKSMEVSPIYMSSLYRERIDAHVASLNKAAAGAGADHRLVNITEPLDSVLRSYLMFRHRR